MRILLFKCNQCERVIPPSDEKPETEAPGLSVPSIKAVGRPGADGGEEWQRVHSGLHFCGHACLADWARERAR